MFDLQMFITKYDLQFMTADSREIGVIALLVRASADALTAKNTSAKDIKRLYDFDGRIQISCNHRSGIGCFWIDALEVVSDLEEALRKIENFAECYNMSNIYLTYSFSEGVKIYRQR